MAHLAVIEVLGNPYLCMAIAEQHPTAYARLMLVSRRFYDWLNGKEEIVVYDRVSQEFRKKVSDKKVFKQKYLESWVVTNVAAGAETTVFLHSRRTHSIGDKPSYVWRGSQLLRSWSQLFRSWSDNGRSHRDNGPAEISIWPAAKELIWRKNCYKYRKDGPARVYVYGFTRAEEWHDERGHWKTVSFTRIQGDNWIPTSVVLKATGFTRYLVSLTSEFLLEAGEAHVEHDFD